VVPVDQGAIRGSRRSNPATYTGLLDPIRKAFAKANGVKPALFSTGIMAFLGAILNFSFVFAGSAGVNPAMIAVGLLVILAWRNAGWYGLDRYVLPRLGTPWHRGELFTRSTPAGGTRGQAAHA